VAWQYSANYGNNDREKEPAPGGTFGQDPYGFVMLDGPEGAISGSFPNDFTIVRREARIKKKKRDIITTDQAVIDSVFEHKEETIHVYCNYKPGSPECTKIFHYGTKDMIIKLPPHIGDGPFARIVSMEPVDDFELPEHHCL
jgi:hypothetical protein